MAIGCVVGDAGAETDVAISATVEAEAVLVAAAAFALASAFCCFFAR
jgi:hypothetical protein